MRPPGTPLAGSPQRGVVELRLADLGHHGPPVLRAVDAVATEGAHVLVIGDNGSGKTTLLQTIAGLLPKQGGHVLVQGRDPLADRRTVHRTTGHLGHRDPFYPELSGRENLHFYASLKGLGPEAVGAALRDIGLQDAADRPVATYSHGMRRRLGLAKALLGDPTLVLLDEPESGLDAHGRTAFHDRLARDPARTVLLSTHHWEAWLPWADHAWLLGGGRLLDVRLDGDQTERRHRVENASRRLGEGAS